MRESMEVLSGLAPAEYAQKYWDWAEKLFKVRVLDLEDDEDTYADPSVPYGESVPASIGRIFHGVFCT